VRERIFLAGETLFEEGQISNTLRVIKLGTVFAQRRGLDGHSRPIGVLRRGSAFGLFGAFDRPSQVTGVALTRVRVCELPIEPLSELGRCSGQALMHLMNAIVDNFAALAAWSEAMRVPGMINQLACVALLLADASHSELIELPSQDALARLLGIRRESIARGLNALELEGGIRRLDRRRCEVHRCALLARLARESY
jgi:CRP-like cAMP-binding protein